jgi:hypothetical protein
MESIRKNSELLTLIRGLAQLNASAGTLIAQ